MNQELYDRIDEAMGFLLEPALVREMAEVGQLRKARPGMTLMHLGDAFTHMPVILDGTVKVMRQGADGNEMLLYYLERGDTCAMSLSCCMGNKKSKVHAVAEEDTLIVMIPVAYLDAWICKYQTWKAYIFDAVRLRMDEFLETIDGVAFMRLDERLLKYLRDRARVLGSAELHITHQAIADDLHTARVVVSRLLKQLEIDGKVILGRNHVEVKEL